MTNYLSQEQRLQLEASPRDGAHEAVVQLESAEHKVARQRRYGLWRVLTVALMGTGYAGYYLCRSDLSVIMPMLSAEMAQKGISPAIAQVRLGTITSFGVLAYGLGKFPTGWLADRFGGRLNFLSGMAGSILFTILFALSGGFPLFTLAWMSNRMVQALGWNSIVKISSRWFSYSAYGAVMGVLSLSYLLGDAASREFMSLLIAAGLGWRSVFFVAAATLGVLLLLNILFLKASPQDIGCPEPPSNPANLFGSEDERQIRPDLRSLVKTFARSGAFWLICLLSVGVTILRETFNLWTPTYFTQSVGLSVADAAQKSALFPLFGALSVVAAGFLSDRLGEAGRAIIIFYGMLLSALVLSILAWGHLGASKLVPVALVALVALVMMGPYSYLSGAISLDFGGKQASGSASGFIDGTGYLGGILAGNLVARVSVTWGWHGVFALLTTVALLSAAAAGVYLKYQMRSRRQAVSTS